MSINLPSTKLRSTAVTTDLRFRSTEILGFKDQILRGDGDDDDDVDADGVARR